MNQIENIIVKNIISLDFQLISFQGKEENAPILPFRKTG